MRTAIFTIAGIVATVFYTEGYAQVPGAPPGSGDHFQNVANAFQANQSTLAVSQSAHQNFLENNPSARGLGRPFNAGGMGGGMPGGGFGFAGGQPWFDSAPAMNRLYVRNQTGTAVWVEVSGNGFYRRIRVSNGQMRPFPVMDGNYSITYRNAVNGGGFLGDQHVSVFGGRAIVRLY